MVEAFQGAEDRSSHSFIISEAKEHVQLLGSWRIAKVKRECNSVAHELAQLARRNVHSAVWRDQALVCVHDLLKNDCIPLI